MSHLRDFVARLHRVIKSQRATVQLHDATLSRRQTEPTRLMTIFLVAYYRAMLCMRATSHWPVSVSVCLSVTSRSSTKTALLQRFNLITSICSGLVVQVVTALLCGNWQDFN